MSVGTTASFVMKRNEIILAALKKVTHLNENEQVSVLQFDAALKALNRIIREEDERGTDQAKNLWALSEAAVFLRVRGYIYGVSQGLNNNIRDIVSVVFRDRSGGDCPVDLIDARTWGRLFDHKDTGDPEKVYFKRDRLLASQQFMIDRAPTTLGTTSVVIGTDSNSYSCILGHTASSENQPITGASWPLYWQKGTSTPAAWASGTAYTNGELLYYVYKRPLFDFTLPSDNPDMPAGWDGYLIYRLAVDLAADYNVSAEKMQTLLAPALVGAREALFPSSRSGAEDFHNKVEFFVYLLWLWGSFLCSAALIS